MILRATYRPAGQTNAPSRAVDHEHPVYADALEAARAEKREGEVILHLRRVDPDAS